ncbi:phosphonopyruvate decarboxylase [Polynucleobacter paneuropaeus]|nr:phosphonopyruvate decarboxylase [Polynucleobacter paneuropaeus]
MIDPIKFVHSLRELGISIITGVPDSLLKELCAAISLEMDGCGHVVAANEGSAVGFAIGGYLATGLPGLVYMQNSGLGNAINPIVSLADSQVYGIPMILVIGWRGELDLSGSQVMDEPQHIKQGQITLELLKTLGIPYQIIDANSKIEEALKNAYEVAVKDLKPVAIVVRKGAFSSLPKQAGICDSGLSREQAIHIVATEMPADLPIVATTGMASRELYEIRQRNNISAYGDFLTVGGMGHASAIAHGIAESDKSKKVICIDGDGALIMHMGTLIYGAKYKNLIHVVINNGAHDSVGGQPTVAQGLNLAQIASACGFDKVWSLDSADSIRAALRDSLNADASSFIEIKCKTGSRDDLGRPRDLPRENLKKIMNFLRGK